MRIAKHYSHLNGLEYLMVHRSKLWREVRKIVAAVDAKSLRTKISKEKGMVGEALFAPKEMNAAYKVHFEAAGWSERRTNYWVTDDAELIRRTLNLADKEQKERIGKAGKRPILSYNQTDFVKDRVAVEVQFGKYAFVAYDLFVKHMAFYVGDLIDVGVEILPMKALQENMSSGPGYYEGELYNLIRQGRGVPAVPLVLVGVVP